MRSLAYARETGSTGGNGFNPFFRGGAVGYQPVIITLPEGANLSATAVISADRRYVRVTPALLLGIAEVNIFNMSTGASGTSNGGTGGKGFSGGGIGGGGNRAASAA